MVLEGRWRAGQVVGGKGEKAPTSQRLGRRGTLVVQECGHCGANCKTRQRKWAVFCDKPRDSFTGLQLKLLDGLTVG
jgi:hypothetical protein